MNVTIKPSVLEGELIAPPSKSAAHRLLICAGLSEGESEIKNIAYSDDILATIGCLEALGAKTQKGESSVKISGVDPRSARGDLTLFAGESGSTLRFFLPVALLSSGEKTFLGKGRLLQRPMSVYEELAEKKNFSFSQSEERIKVSGELKSGVYEVKGNISSQFISGLLFTLVFCEGDSTIKIIPPIESIDYINMTIEAMKRFSANVFWKSETEIFVEGKPFQKNDLTVEGDYSNAAFFESFNLFGSKIKIKGLNKTSLQSDKVYEKYFEKLSSGFAVLDVRNCPDLAPILMSVATMKNGGILTGTKRLKIKESDRAEVMKDELSKFSAKITVEEDRVIIEKKSLTAAKEPLFCHNDHRIAMALSVVASRFSGKLIGAECVKKSYPNFFSEAERLGLEVIYDD